jgi:hypothetical protein
MTKRLQSTCLESDIEIALVDKGFFRSPNLPRSEWNAVPENLKPIVRRLLPLIDEEKARWEGDKLIVPNAVASQFPESIASALGLPSPAPVFVDISFIGTIAKDPCVQVDWKDTNYQTIAPQRTGLLIKWGNRIGRLQGPLHALIDAIDRFNDVAFDALSLRVERWNEVSTALATVNPNVDNVDGYTKSLTVFQAGSFALDVRGVGDRIDDFMPVLMHRGKAKSLEDNAPTLDLDVPPGAQEPLVARFNQFERI